jgi:hypothetical protein
LKLKNNYCFFKALGVQRSRTFFADVALTVLCAAIRRSLEKPLPPLSGPGRARTVARVGALLLFLKKFPIFVAKEKKQQNVDSGL